MLGRREFGGSRLGRRELVQARTEGAWRLQVGTMTHLFKLSDEAPESRGQRELGV